MATAEECAEPLKYQTWILKVSIHCQGCEKKVKKVLQTMEGVYKTTVDSQQHKVVVTGNVEAEALIKRLLIKLGKHAEVWPEKTPPAAAEEKETVVDKKNKKKPDGHASPETGSATTVEKKEIVSPANSKKSVDDGESAANKCGKGESSQPKENENKGEKKATVAAASSGGGGGKNKAKKAEKDNSSTTDHNANNGVGKSKSKSKSESGAEVIAPAQQEYDNKKELPDAVLVAALPLSSAFDYPLQMPPSYGVSYSSMQPSMSYGGAYYAAFPVLQSGYMFSPPPPPPPAGSCCYYPCEDYYSGACNIM
ncbi:heavy metal-associated isoprenylated plant protein 35-like [Zingiber officinale]|uniref:HMA domain-containing protein n=1 Tax=Zingiber officinale TaxID=94328 RepID=A0A8J5G1L1_ZINOF|nr:heavy metal-associated isoprenylated plant protein 35-like [Zingiber officinale]KAG6499263.1 hypothetical protein ZIOFF_039020 [Zingiber officinale]